MNSSLIYLCYINIKNKIETYIKYQVPFKNEKVLSWYDQNNNEMKM